MQFDTIATQATVNTVKETLSDLLQQLTEAVIELDVPDDHLSGDRLTQVPFNSFSPF
jgi:hypothetical protein